MQNMPGLCYNGHTMKIECILIWKVGVIMIIISKSPGTCGTCGANLEVEWDLDLIDYYEKDGGICNFYESDVEIVCPKCENHILARLRAIEYPEGVLEDSGVKIKEDGAGRSCIEEPQIEFFDL